MRHALMDFRPAPPREPDFPSSPEVAKKAVSLLISNSPKIHFLFFPSVNLDDFSWHGNCGANDYRAIDRDWIAPKTW